MNALTYEFEGHSLTQLEIDGRPAWVAREVGVALGYSDGRRLVDSIRNRWADELVDGVDCALLEGKALETLKRDTKTVFSSHSKALLVLFESGLHMVLLKTPKQAGRRLRRFLVTEILPRLVRQEAVVTAGLEVRREERLAERQAAQLAKWSFEERLAKAEALRRAMMARHEAGEIDRIELAAWLVYVAELVNGSDLPRARGPIPAAWSTPTQIGLRLGVTAYRVGRVISELGLRTTAAGLARPGLREERKGAGGLALLGRGRAAHRRGHRRWRCIMSTFRVRAGQVFDFRGLRSQERLVLLAWLTHANPDGVAWPSIARLARMTSLGERTVRRELKRLRERGVLEDLGRTPRGGLRLRFRSYPQRSAEPRSAGTARPGRSGRGAPAPEAHEQVQENQSSRTNPLPYPLPSGRGDRDQVQFIIEWARDVGVDDEWWERAREGHVGVCHAVHRAMTKSKSEGGFRGSTRYRDLRGSLAMAATQMLA